jgi:hypothetical protein
MNQEIWKPVVGYEGFYEVSNLGRVQSLDRMCLHQNRFLKGKVLSQKTNRGGYHVVHLRSKFESHPTVHKLVAESFLPNPNKKPTVNHIDGVKTNNQVCNLEWATHSEQMTHAISTGLYSPPVLKTYRGEEHGFCKIKDKDLPVILKMREDGLTLKTIASTFNVGISQIHRIVKGKSRCR